MNTTNAPKIRINANTGVVIDPIHSFNDLAVISGKFAKLVDADKPGSVMRLTTAVGDLTASVQDGDTTIGMAEEVADVVIAAMVVAAQHNVCGELLRRVVMDRMGKQAQEVISKHFEIELDRRMAA